MKRLRDNDTTPDAPPVKRVRLDRELVGGPRPLVAVVGAPGAGKSAFINARLGAPLLPSSLTSDGMALTQCAVRCVSEPESQLYTVTHVREGQESCSVAYQTDARTPDAVKLVNKALRRIFKRVAADDELVLMGPFPLWPHDVDLLDLPGWNFTVGKSAATYLSEADTIVYVTPRVAGPAEWERFVRRCPPRVAYRHGTLPPLIISAYMAALGDDGEPIGAKGDGHRSSPGWHNTRATTQDLIAALERHDVHEDLNGLASVPFGRTVINTEKCFAVEARALNVPGDWSSLAASTHQSALIRLASQLRRAAIAAKDIRWHLTAKTKRDYTDARQVIGHAFSVLEQDVTTVVNELCLDCDTFVHRSRFALAAELLGTLEHRLEQMCTKLENDQALRSFPVRSAFVLATRFTTVPLAALATATATMTFNPRIYLDPLGHELRTCLAAIHAHVNDYLVPAQPKTVMARLPCFENGEEDEDFADDLFRVSLVEDDLNELDELAALRPPKRAATRDPKALTLCPDESTPRNEFRLARQRAPFALTLTCCPEAFNPLLLAADGATILVATDRDLLASLRDGYYGGVVFQLVEHEETFFYNALGDIHVLRLPPGCPLRSRAATEFLRSLALFLGARGLWDMRDLGHRGRPRLATWHPERLVLSSPCNYLEGLQRMELIAEECERPIIPTSTTASTYMDGLSFARPLPSPTSVYFAYYPAVVLKHAVFAAADDADATDFGEIQYLTHGPVRVVPPMFNTSQ